jgi:hypothetical protein
MSGFATQDEVLAPYAALLRLAELALALAGECRYEELAQLEYQSAQIVGRLPARPPAQARDLLTRAALMQRNVTIELLRRREQVLLNLRRVELSARAAQGYGQAVARPRVQRVQAKA